MEQQVDVLLKKLPHSFEDLSEKVKTVELWPYFVFVHYVLVALSMRARSGAQDYAKTHPFPSWFVCITSCFGGTLIVNFLTNKPMIQVYTNTNNVMLASLVWYLIFFSPFDIVDKILKITLTRCVLIVMKEVQRIRVIYDGVAIAISLYQGKFFIAVLLGSVKGSGAKFLMRPLDSFIRGNLMSDNEFLKPTFSTKYSIVASILIILRQQGHTQIDLPILLCCLFIVSAFLQIVMLLTEMRDPFEPIENLVAMVLLRGPEEIVKETKKKTE